MSYRGEFDSSDSEEEDSTKKHLQRIMRAFDSVPISTTFSGIDAPSTGLRQQISELNARTKGCSTRKPLHLHGIEWFAPSQGELLAHPCHPGCLFGDITMFLSPCLRMMFSEMVNKGKLMEILKPMISDGKAITTNHDWITSILSAVY